MVWKRKWAWSGMSCGRGLDGRWAWSGRGGGHGQEGDMDVVWTGEVGVARRETRGWSGGVWAWPGRRCGRDQEGAMGLVWKGVGVVWKGMWAWPGRGGDRGQEGDMGVIWTVSVVLSAGPKMRLNEPF